MGGIVAKVESIGAVIDHRYRVRLKQDVENFHTDCTQR